MSLLDERARPKRRRPFDERPDPFGRLPEFLPPDDRPEFDDPFDLSEPVGRDGRNRRDDVARIETLLGRAGYLDLDPTDGPTGFFGLRLDQAIRKFQKNRGLKADGAVLPGGETIGALAASVEIARPNDKGTDPEPQQRLAAAAVPGVLPFIPPLIGALGTILQRVVPPGGGRPDPRDMPEQEKCEQQFAKDTVVCDRIGYAFGKKAARRCHDSAMVRYSNCLAGRDIPDLDAGTD